MKKNAVRVLSLLLVAAMLLVAGACTQTIHIRFVDKDGGDLVFGGQQSVNVINDGANVPAGNTTAAPAGNTTAAPAGDTTAAPAGNTTAAPAGDTTAAPAAAPAGLTASSSKEEIVAKYIEVYNTTKATGTFIGRDKMECPSVTIDGKENSLVKNAAGSVMKTDETKTYQLPPFTDDNPGTTCATKAEDIESATFKDNGDGTATIKLTPKPVTNAKRFQDAQGNMFNVMEDVASALANISLVSWSEGDANSNVVLSCEGSYCEITYNTSSNMMTKAEYVLGTTAAVTHANVLILKDKSATAKFVYTMSYPG